MGAGGVAAYASGCSLHPRLVPGSCAERAAQAILCDRTARNAASFMAQAAHDRARQVVCHVDCPVAHHVDCQLARQLAGVWAVGRHRPAAEQTDADFCFQTAPHKASGFRGLKTPATWLGGARPPINRRGRPGATGRAARGPLLRPASWLVRHGSAFATQRVARRDRFLCGRPARCFFARGGPFNSNLSHGALLQEFSHV